MENESIKLEFSAKGGTVGDGSHLSDNRQLTVQATRGELAKFMDEVCEMIETRFEQ